MRIRSAESKAIVIAALSALLFIACAEEQSQVVTPTLSQADIACLTATPTMEASASAVQRAFAPCNLPTSTFTPRQATIRRGVQDGIDLAVSPTLEIAGPKSDADKRKAQ
jgi:hypothetical protein